MISCWSCWKSKHVDMSPEGNYWFKWNCYIAQKCFCLVLFFRKRMRRWKNICLFVQIYDINYFSTCFLYECNFALSPRRESNLRAKHTGKYRLIHTTTPHHVWMSPESQRCFLFSFLFPPSFVSPFLLP